MTKFNSLYQMKYQVSKSKIDKKKKEKRKRKTTHTGGPSHIEGKTSTFYSAKLNGREASPLLFSQAKWKEGALPFCMPKSN